MRENFNNVMAQVLGHEGGKSNHPADPGRKTNQGVIQTTYTKWRISQGLSDRDVFSMSNAERDAIYKTLYWDVIRGDELPIGVDMVVMDGAVNSGPIQSGKWLQRSLGGYYTGEIDGRIGPLTIAAIHQHPSPSQLINAICDRRMAFLTALSTFTVFGKGWTRRVSEVRATALAMVRNGTAGQLKVPNAVGMDKAPVSDAKRLPTTTAGDVAVATGASNGGIAIAVEQLRNSVEPYAAVSDFISWLVIVLAITGFVLTVGGFIWRMRSSKKAVKMVDVLDLSTVNPYAPV